MAAGADDSPAWAPGLRFLTEDEPPIPLLLRERLEDFVVEEQPSFTPSGEGEHLFVLVEKRGLSTDALAAHARRIFDLRPTDVGYAGRKDAQAVTRQWLSLTGVATPDAARLEDDRVRVLQVTRNDKKLRLGALAGNRFELLLRGIAEADRPRVVRVLERLAERGLPNYFGGQRFGADGRGFELGRLLYDGDAHGYLRARFAVESRSPVASPAREAADVDHAAPTAEEASSNASEEVERSEPAASSALEEFAAALESGSRGDLRRLAKLASRLPREAAGLARQLARRPGDWSSALRALDRGSLTMHLSALQSRVFNRLLASRLETFDRPLLGDLVQFHTTRSQFAVGPDENLDELARRAAAFELAPTGGLFGGRAEVPTGEPGRLERAALEAEGVDPAASRGALGPPLPGARRLLRVPVAGLRHDFEPEGLRLAFELPPGCFATTLVSEISKTP